MGSTGFDEARWRRKLRRLRLDAEPIADQLDRHRRATVVLSGVIGAIGLVFLGIFAAFGRVDVGLILVGVLLVPAAAAAWVDEALLRSRASAYLRARSAAGAREDPPG